MNHTVPHFEKVSRRVAQVVFVSFTVICVALVIAIGVAAVQLARMQKQLAPMIQRELTLMLGRPVRIGAVQVRGLDEIVISDAQIANGTTFANGTALTVPTTTAHVNLLDVVLHHSKSPVESVQQVTVSHPNLAVNRSQAGRWDFQDVVDHFKAKMTGAPAWHAQVQVNGGGVAYQDAHGYGAQAAPIHEDIVNINATVTPSADNSYGFKVAATDASHKMGHFRLKGMYSGKGDTRVDVSADRVAVEAITKYLPKNLPITFTNGTAALRLSALISAMPSPADAHHLSKNKLTADVDLTGVGLHLQEMSAPIVANSGRLRLIYDNARYPSGSQLEFINVQASAANVPAQVSGTIKEINLFDLANTQPVFNMTVKTALHDGTVISKLFPGTPWLQKMQLDGGVGIDAAVTGRRGDIHIDGTLQSDGVHLPDFQGTGASAKFHLLPDADGTQPTPTVQAALQFQHAALGNAEFNDLAVTANSATGWRHLDDDLHITGTAEASRVHAPWGDSDAVTGEYHADRTGVDFQTIHGQIFGGEVAGTAHIPFQIAGQPAVGITATAHYTGVDLAKVAGQLHFAELAGAGKGDLTLDIVPGKTLVLDTNLTASAVQFRTYHATALQTNLHVVAGNDTIHIDIPHADAQTEYGVFTATNGAYDSDTGHGAGGSLKLPIHAENIPLQHFGYEPLQGMATLDGTLTGSLDAPTLTATVAAKDGSLLGRSFAEAHSDLSYQGKSLLLRNLVFTRPGMALTIPGGAGFDPRNGLTGLDATLQVAGAPLQEVIALAGQQLPWKVDGNTEGTAAIHITETGALISGTASMPNPTVHLPFASGEYPLHLDKATLNFDINGRQMQVHDLQIEQGATVLHAQGTVTSPEDKPASADLTFKSDQARLENFPLHLLGIPFPLNGPAQVAGSVKGVLNGMGSEPLIVKVNSTTTQLQAAGIPVGAGAVELTYNYRPQARELTIEHGTVDNAAFHATTTGHYQLDRGQMDGVQVSLDNIDLSTLRQVATRDLAGQHVVDVNALLAHVPAQLTGRGQVQLTATGRIMQPDVRMQLGFTQLAMGATPLPNVHGTVLSNVVNGRYQFHIDNLVAEGDANTGHAQVSGDVDPLGNVQLKFMAADFSAKALAPWVGQLPVDGRANLSGTVNGPWRQPLLEADVNLAQPVISGHALYQVSGHLREDADRLTLSNGAVQLAANAQPITVQGELPLGWGSLRQPLAENTQPISLTLTLPRQNLAALQPFMPSMPAMNGTVEGAVQVAGTLAHPQLTNGQLAMLGSATMAGSNGAQPSLWQNIDLRLNLANDGRQSQVTVTHFSAQNATTGSVASTGSVSIPNEALSTPTSWNWNLYAQVVLRPFAAFQIPSTSGLLHLTNDNLGPVVHGVLLLENAKLSEPKGSGGAPAVALGPFPFNPRLSLVVEIGSGVKVSQGMFSVTLLSTPLPRAAVPIGLPSQNITPNPQYDWNTAMLHPGTSSELPGTWGAVTGTLSDPYLYARFEVDKHKLSFPLNLLGSVRNAKGTLTYSQAQGAQIVMGIDDLPKEQAMNP